MKKRWLWLLLLGLCLILAGCGKREAPAMLQMLEECDAACCAKLKQITSSRREEMLRYRTNGLDRIEGVELIPAFDTLTDRNALLLKFLVCEDFFGNLSKKGKDLTEYQSQYLYVYISGTELMTEPLHTWLREGARKSFLCLSVMEDPPKWTTDGENMTVFRLTAPDAFFRDDGTGESMKLRKSLRAAAKKQEKTRVPNAVWYDGDLFWDNEHSRAYTGEDAIVDFYWTEADCG